MRRAFGVVAAAGLVMAAVPWLGPEGLRWGGGAPGLSLGLLLLGLAGLGFGLDGATRGTAWNCRVRAGFSYAGMGLLAAFLMAPFVWMVLVSLHPAKAPIPTLANLVPAEPAWGNYTRVLTDPLAPVGRFFLNSVLVTVAVVGGQLLVVSLAAYAFARLRFPGREAVFALFLLSMMFAGPVTQIPVYLMVREAGLLDTYGALIVPGLSSAFNVFLLRQFFMAIPRELDEAAKLDGATELQVYWRVVMPLSKTALATAAAFTFIGVWTDFFWPLISLSSLHLYTLEVGLSFFRNSYGQANWPLQMTAAVIVMAPILLVFLFAQRYFVKGITVGSIK